MPDQIPAGTEPKRFRAELYDRPQSRAELAVEKEVYGAHVGVRGYTSLSQADTLAERLHLGPGMRLLDIGAGRGFPGLYIAERTGCSVVITDLPAGAVRNALGRVKDKALGRRSAFLLAGATHLPFRPRIFDAITNTDVL